MLGRIGVEKDLAGTEGSSGKDPQGKSSEATAFSVS